jgi:ribosome modulation factor
MDQVKITEPKGKATPLRVVKNTDNNPRGALIPPDMDTDLYIYHAGELARVEREFGETYRLAKKKARRAATDAGARLDFLDMSMRMGKWQDHDPLEWIKGLAHVAWKLRTIEASSEPLFALGQSEGDPDLRKSFDLGYIDGFQGKTQDNPYDTTTAGGQQWLKGWHDGQAKLATHIKGLKEAEKEAAKAAKAELKATSKTNGSA